MNRQLLINLLQRHIPIPACGDDYYFGVKCSCDGLWHKNEESWARHVANAIYPE